MSMSKCAICEDIYDTDFQMEVNELGDCICDRCFNEKASECDCCGEDAVCRNTLIYGMETVCCHECSNT